MKHLFVQLGAAILFCSFFVYGCSGLQIKRGVQNNVFYSSSKPKLNIEVNPEFLYSGDVQEHSNQFLDSSSLKIPHIRVERYSFKNNNNNREIHIITKHLTEKNIYWRPFDFKNVKNVIDAGTKTFNDKTYQYGVFNLIQKQKCYLVKVIGRITGGNRKTQMVIYYAEELGYKNNCSRWENRMSLTNEQKERLKSFLEDFQNDISILDYAEITH